MTCLVQRIGFSCTLVAAFALASCVQAPSHREYSVIIRAETGENAPLAGVAVLAGSERLGSSQEDGRIAVKLRGMEGEVLALQVACPGAHREASQPLTVTLRTLEQDAAAPLYQVRCEPLLRSVVVAVRADRGANLPVLYLGQEVARTDQAGSAHVLLQSAPEGSLELTLDTSESPGLRPHSPSTRFEVPATDDLLVLEQSFTLPAAANAAPQRRAPGIINIKRRVAR